MDRLPRRERELCKLSVIAVQLVARIFCFVSCHFFWLMAKVVGSNGPTPPTLFMGFWCAAPFPCFFVWWMKQPSTLEFLAVIGDVFSNLCCNFRGFGTKGACFEQVQRMGHHMFGCGKDSLSASKYCEVPILFFPFLSAQ